MTLRCAQICDTTFVSLNHRIIFLMIVHGTIGGALVSLELLLPSISKFINQILDSYQETLNLILKPVTHPYSTFHVPLLLIKTLCIDLLEHV